MTAFVLRWDVADFEFQEQSLQEGYIASIFIELGASGRHLLQQDSIFFSDQTGLEDLPSRAVRGVDRKPQWRRRSDRYWPALAGQPLPFLCQWETASDVVYLFGRLEEAAPLAAYADALGTQDIEDHYDEEARRGDA